MTQYFNVMVMRGVLRFMLTSYTVIILGIRRSQKLFARKNGR